MQRPSVNVKISHSTGGLEPQCSPRSAAYGACYCSQSYFSHTFSPRNMLCKGMRTSMILSFGGDMLLLMLLTNFAVPCGLVRVRRFAWSGTERVCSCGNCCFMTCEDMFMDRAHFVLIRAVIIGRYFFIPIGCGISTLGNSVAPWSYFHHPK